MKRMIRMLSAVMALTIILALAGCSSGPKVIYTLPEGATGTAPSSQACKEYDSVEVPAIDSTLNGAPQVGWKDVNGKVYANGDVVTVGSADLTLTAAYQANVIAKSFCENPGTMNFGGRFIGPSAAYTVFYADKTWTADANGVACFSHFEGTWDLSQDGQLSMILVEQDGVQANAPVEVTYDGKTFTYTLTHPGDRGGTKYHTNHISAYQLITAYNAATGAAVTAPEEPTFTISFEAGNENAEGKTASISGKLGETVVLPDCGFTTEGATFAGWQCTVFTEDSERGLLVETVTLQPGENLEILCYDMVVTAAWNEAEASDSQS